MDINTVSQIVTVVLAVLAIIWHQQRTTDKLRSDFERAYDKLRDGLDEVKQRLSRIEGFLGIGMSPAAASEASGAGLTSQPQGPTDGD